ncbi:MAG: cysteine--tRNA ligase [Candidatus Omnitrophica bacterium]|nr:cysteine--tRNA ligase [Candidatus Omnitrophota bacterium]
MIRFYNTLTKRKEEFIPIEDKIVKLYTCGPTVYDLAHIGNFRAYVFEDLLHRYLEYRGYKVIRVMNITDVDDKTINGAKSQGISLREYTDRYIKIFLEDMETLRLKKPDFLPRATEHINEMVELIKKLLEKGYAYYKDNSIYFSISKFSSYGKLSGIDLSQIKVGARVDTDEYEKEDVRDFVLWKSAKEKEVWWETEIGKGRPGWHIECSAMSMKYLGETFDIHTGGVDNIFPHHENEIAQSESATGKKFVNYWLHCAHLLVNGEKMSKSKGNFYTLRDLLNKGYNPVAIRYLLLSTHYRDPLNFTEKSLKQAENTVKNYNEFYQGLNICASRKYNPEIKKEIEKAKERFIKGLDDDLNISFALSSIFNLIKIVNIFFSKGEFGAENVKEVKEFIEEIDSVLCIIEKKEEFLPENILNLIKEREIARNKKDYKRADEIRNILKEKGIFLEDTPYGTRWKKITKT